MHPTPVAVRIDLVDAEMWRATTRFPLASHYDSMTDSPQDQPPRAADAGYLNVRLRPGDWVAGRFQIIRQLGRGGFGRVYEARQDSMGQRRIALKILAPRNAREPNAEGRFKQEALLASRLSHPNTITLFDFGATEAGLFYIAMEYLDGETLGMVLRRGALSVARCEHVAVQLLRSLAEAHSIGLIHRDLKPDNIFLCQIFGERDFVKVLDFGLAKIAGVLEERAAQGQLPRSARTDLTLEGLVCGTPEYMAPEQARGIEPLTPACDVYAVGLLIFNMLTGAKPYSGSTPVEILQKQVGDILPPLPPRLANTRVARLMKVATRKNPEERYPDASAMLYALTGRLPLDPLGAEAEAEAPPAFQKVKTQRFAPVRLDKAPPQPSAASFQVEVNIEASRTAHAGHLVPPSIGGVEVDAFELDPTPSPSPAAVDAEEAALLDEPEPLEPGEITASHPRATQRFEEVVAPSDVLEPVTGSLQQIDPDATSPGLSLSELPALSMVGFSSPTHAQKAASQATPGLLSGQVPLVGREGEVKQLLGIVRATAQRQTSRIVILKGDPGVGKSRLLSEIVRIVRDTSDTLVAGSYFRDPNAAPLEGLRRLFCHIFGLEPEVAAALRGEDRLVKTLQASLEQLAIAISDAELRLLARILVNDDDISQLQSASATLDPTAAPALVLFRLRRLLLEISRQRPMFLILEDVQFADPASLDLIRRLAMVLSRQDEEPRPRPSLCLVITLRRDTSNERKDLVDLLQLLLRYVDTVVDVIPIQGLSDDACSQLIDALVPLEPELRRRVAEAAHGNPLHAMEVVRHLYEGQRLTLDEAQQRFALEPGAALSLPLDMTEMLRLRVTQVIEASEAAEAMQELLYRLVVLGRRVPLELLRTALDLEERPWPRQLLDKLLVELLETGLVHLDGQDALPLASASHAAGILARSGNLTFEHGLLHEILLREVEGTLAGRRLHRKAARAKQAFFDTGRQELAAELAQHFIRAGEPAEGLPFVVEAACHSQQVGDLLGALARFGDADRMLTNHPEIVGAVPAALVHQIGLAMGHLNMRLGRLGPAQFYLERTYQQCTTSRPGDVQTLTLARAHLYLGELSQVHKLFDQARGHLEQARLLGESADPVAVDVVQKALILLGELRLAEEGQLEPTYIRDFEAKLERVTTDFPLLKARGLQHLGNVAVGQHDPQLAERFLARAGLIVDEVGDPSLRAPINSDLGFALLLQGQTAQGEGLLRQAHHWYRELGDRLALSICLYRLGLAAWQRHAPEEAMEVLEEALRIQLELELGGQAAETWELVGRIHEAEGKLGQAREAYDSSLRAHNKRRPDFDANLRMRLGSTLLKLGDLDAAYRNLESARSYFESVPEGPELVQCLNLLAMIASWQDHLHHAARLLQRSALVARSVDDPSGESFALAALAMVLHYNPDPTLDPPDELVNQARLVHSQHDLQTLQLLLDCVEMILDGQQPGSEYDALPPLHRTWLDQLGRNGKAAGLDR